MSVLRVASCALCLMSRLREYEAEDFRAEEMEIYLNEIHLRQKSMDDVWRDDIDFDVFKKR